MTGEINPSLSRADQRKYKAAIRLLSAKLDMLRQKGHVSALEAYGYGMEAALKVLANAAERGISEDRLTEGARNGNATDFSEMGLADHTVSEFLATQMERQPACAVGCAFCCVGQVDFSVSIMSAKRYSEMVSPENDGALWHPRACPLLNPVTKACQVHPVRPPVCRCYLSYDVDECSEIFLLLDKQREYKAFPRKKTVMVMAMRQFQASAIICAVMNKKPTIITVPLDKAVRMFWNGATETEVAQSLGRDRYIHERNFYSFQRDVLGKDIPNSVARK